MDCYEMIADDLTKSSKNNSTESLRLVMEAELEFQSIWKKTSDKNRVSGSQKN